MEDKEAGNWKTKFSNPKWPIQAGRGVEAAGAGPASRARPESRIGFPGRLVDVRRRREFLQRIEIRQKVAGRFHRFGPSGPRGRRHFLLQESGRPPHRPRRRPAAKTQVSAAGTGAAGPVNCWPTPSWTNRPTATLSNKRAAACSTGRAKSGAMVATS